MSLIALSILGGAAIGAAANSNTAEAQTEAINNQSEIQAQTTQEIIDFQNAIYETIRDDFQPWRETGEWALNELQTGLQNGAFDANVDLYNDPSYQFRLEEGMKGVENSASAGGMTQSGAQQKAIVNYNQNAASQEYSNAYNRASNEATRQYNMLYNLSNSGQSAAAGQANAAQQLSNNQTNVLASYGNQQSQNAWNQGQVNSNQGINNANTINSGIQNWLLYSLM